MALVPARGADARVGAVLPHAVRAPTRVAGERLKPPVRPLALFAFRYALLRAYLTGFIGGGVAGLFRRAAPSAPPLSGSPLDPPLGPSDLLRFNSRACWARISAISAS